MTTTHPNRAASPFRYTAIACLCAALTACSDTGTTGGGGGTTKITTDKCSMINNPAGQPHQGSAAGLLTGTNNGYTFDILTQPTRGQVSIDSASGNYTYTPPSAGQGFLDSFVVGVYENGTLRDRATVSIIYGEKRVLPLGDSITYGVTSFTEASGNQPTQGDAVGYRAELLDQLDAGGYSVDFVGQFSGGASTGISDVHHQGSPGWVIDDPSSTNRLTNSVPSNVLNGLKPDMVLLYAGTNDLFLLDTVATAAADMITLLNQLQSWSTSANHPLTVLVGELFGTHPNSSHPGASDARMAQFNTQIRAQIASNFDNNNNPDFQVELVEFANITPSTDISAPPGDRDGLHPNANGYAKMASTWYTAMTDSGDMAKCE